MKMALKLVFLAAAAVLSVTAARVLADRLVIGTGILVIHSDVGPLRVASSGGPFVAEIALPPIIQQRTSLR